MLSFLLGFSICLNIALILGILVYINLKKNLDIFSGMSEEEIKNFKNWSDFYS